MREKNRVNENIRKLLMFVCVLTAFLAVLVGNIAFTIFSVGGLLYAMLWGIDGKLRLLLDAGLFK